MYSLLSTSFSMYHIAWGCQVAKLHSMKELNSEVNHKPSDTWCKRLNGGSRVKSTAL